MKLRPSDYIRNHFSKKKQVFKKRDFVYLPKTKVQEIFYIQSGIIKTGCYNKKSTDVTKGILFQGDVFGVLRLFHQESFHDYAQVVSTKAEIVTMTHADFFQKNKLDEGFNLFVLQTISYRLIQLEKKWSSLRSMSIQKRILFFILELGLIQSKKVGLNTLVENPFTHQEIGDIVGASRKRITTILDDLKSQDMIYYNQKEILVKDFKGLEEMFSDF